MTASRADEATVSYSIPREAVLRYGMRQVLTMPVAVGWLASALLLCAAAIAVGGNFVYTSVFVLALGIFVPLRIRRSWATAVDANPVFTEQRTLTFRLSGFTLVNARGRTDSTWEAYSGLSEDAGYFYLHIPGTPIANMVPKTAFSEEQMQLFRRCASRSKA